MSFPRYDSYRDIAEAWLGEVPAHWQLKQLRVLLRPGIDGLKIGPFGSQLTSDMLVAEGHKVYGQENVISKDYTAGDRRISSPKLSELAVYKVGPGDLLITMMGTAGRCGIVPKDAEEGIIDSHLLRLRLSAEVSAEFVELVVDQSNYVRDQLAVLGKGSIMHGLNSSIIRSIKVAIPPSLDEQNAICTFVRRETAKIDALVEEQKRLIELLNEKVASMVFSPDSTIRAREMRLENAIDTVVRPVVRVPGKSYTALGLYNRGRGLFHKDARDQDDIGDSDFFWIEPGDLILSGQFGWEGAVALAGMEEAGCVVSHRYPVVRGKQGVALTEYIFAFFLTTHGTFLLNENSRGAAGRNRPLNMRSLLKEKLLLPSMHWQRDVAKAIEQRRIFLAVIADQLSILEERRSALISAAVTGKIDVRKAASIAEAA